MHALLKLIEFIYSLSNKKILCIVCVSGSQTGIRSVNHVVLLNKLYLYGVRGVPLALIADYPRDRTQCVRLGNVSSAFRTVNICVPQGSILGPLLFRYYINPSYLGVGYITPTKHLTLNFTSLGSLTPVSV